MGIMNAPMMLAASSGLDHDNACDDADRYGVYHRISVDRKTCSSSR